METKKEHWSIASVILSLFALIVSVRTCVREEARARALTLPVWRGVIDEDAESLTIVSAYAGIDLQQTTCMAPPQMGNGSWTADVNEVPVGGILSKAEAAVREAYGAESRRPHVVNVPLALLTAYSAAADKEKHRDASLYSLRFRFSGLPKNSQRKVVGLDFIRRIEARGEANIGKELRGLWGDELRRFVAPDDR